MDDRSLMLEGGSGIAIRLVQREGRVVGGPLDGSLMTEWGLHEIAPGYGEGQGFLAFAHSSGGKAYFRFNWTGRGVVRADGELQPVMFGAWSVHSGSGCLAAIAGAGTVAIGIPSEQERDWQFTGALSL
ncbi:hypothetical protein HRUBRA_02780 [Pseudohaliea rubra DSM 19751]|uniref:Uncharacterized protein n=1 Tax=Pseudohaliea rubra DSM 19751 TaxID=1265313 RepID=A0A095VMG4_9GAMM|nr:hypothetical protein HRUBRA_02780 [Pseudohaliea rubra DSM 19751]